MNSLPRVSPFKLYCSEMESKLVAKFPFLNGRQILSKLKSSWGKLPLEKKKKYENLKGLLRKTSLKKRKTIRKYGANQTNQSKSQKRQIKTYSVRAKKKNLQFDQNHTWPSSQNRTLKERSNGVAEKEQGCREGNYRIHSQRNVQNSSFAENVNVGMKTKPKTGNPLCCAGQEERDHYSQTSIDLYLENSSELKVMRSLFAQIREEELIVEYDRDQEIITRRDEDAECEEPSRLNHLQNEDSQQTEAVCSLFDRVDKVDSEENEGNHEEPTSDRVRAEATGKQRTGGADKLPRHVRGIGSNIFVKTNVFDMFASS